MGRWGDVSGMFVLVIDCSAGYPNFVAKISIALNKNPRLPKGGIKGGHGWLISNCAFRPRLILSG